MKKIYFLLLLSIIISCKDDKPKIIPAAKKAVPTIILTDERKVSIDTAKINSFKSETLKQFYNSSGNKTVWGNLKKRTYILSLLKNSEALGLNPDDYKSSKLEQLEKRIASLKDVDLATYDILLTYNFELYLTHLYKGKLDPKKLYTDWDLEEKKFDVNDALIKAFNNNKLDSIAENIQPKSAPYKELIKALEIINTFPDDSIGTIKSDTKITLKDTSSALINIKKTLLFWKDMSGKSDSLTKIYDEKTFEAVKKFQERHGLAADGVIGAGTISALNYSKERRKQQIIANLERWRWYTNDFSENYFIINIPDYSLNVVEMQDTTLVRNVVVGTSKRKTPIITSVLKSVVFNPTWTVPPTILKEDVVPAMKRNRNYLAKKNITIYDTAGKVVDPKAWNENKPGNYRYVQSPGYNNSLGVMKILFPNHHSVYLHDTNHRNYFGRSNRSLSSGCVRVENPLELAEHILDDSENYSKEKIDTIVASKKTMYTKITKKYALYQWYWTAWSKKNQLIFRADIYNLDSDLYAKLRD
ncbi:L,D-transpeptidase family protein [Flavobacterium reichenbachii]|uniref:Peptidoglycan-binding protein n=1 Tax=Flavobacterium reichenbachii TaxID=362418 RepID=A0A085ZQK9_9FLAO|nr:L,D-transpeptidase family protein [Flavobacterium reichenbachii]KFF06723.1 peptidoglycan-binding protein [Flavobacterium reichenbachii]OXB18673.1 peptidoglycan-binding protein [Flavobacterium reichenbachii]